MPLVSIKILDKSSDTRIAMWHITESVEELVNSSNLNSLFVEEICRKHKNVSRQCEIIAVRLLLNNIFDVKVNLLHDGNGKPCLDNGYNVSISHTKGYAVVIVSKTGNVAIDIEHIGDRVLRIKKMFLREDEMPNDVVPTLIHWCVKETIYKLYSSDSLAFKEIRINEINGDNSHGYVTVVNFRNLRNDIVNYIVTDDYVLTYVYSM